MLAQIQTPLRLHILLSCLKPPLKTFFGFQTIVDKFSGFQDNCGYSLLLRNFSKAIVIVGAFFFL